MSEIEAGQVVLFYLFDVAETADLQALPGLVGGPAVPARLAPKPSTPPYVQYDKPPVAFDGEAMGMGEVDGFRVRVRVYDYGVVSVGLIRPFQGAWHELVALSETFVENPDLEAHAERLCRVVTDRLGPALRGLRSSYLTEDYLVFAVNKLDRLQSADELLAERGDDIAAMLRGERRLSEQEKTTVLNHRISYLADDLVVPTWNAAFVYDTPAGTQAALEIAEFANSQLLEFRHYDRRLDDELETIYGRLQRPRRYDEWIGSRYTRAARQIHSLFIDVHQLTDRTENTVKFIGDIYAARLFALIADRLGLGRWKDEVEGKLETLDDIYRFAVEQSAMSRGEFLELTIVLILVLELLLILMGVMK